jgi:septal ring factor EnvC (AmiA/AmiB activator)
LLDSLLQEINTMAVNGDSLSKLTPAIVEAAVKDVQTTPGGVKLDIVLSPAVQKLTPRSKPAPTTPHTQEEIQSRLAAAAIRRDGLEKLKTKNIAVQLARIEGAKSRREELSAEMSAKSKENLERTLESVERNRETQLEQQRAKLAQQLARVDKTYKQLEVQSEAARIAKECDIVAKLNKAQDKREEQLEERIAKLKMHEQYVQEVRQSLQNMIVEDQTKIEADMKQKLEKAAKERERMEVELKAKLEDHSKHRELVRQNKEKLDTTAPESA